ncbi:MAG: hypothetical protein IJ864_04095 [Alphaproteobacteria bacterium]|nr:hypothetical protein [Alphaproteobacteria bacterium]
MMTDKMRNSVSFNWYGNGCGLLIFAIVMIVCCCGADVALAYEIDLSRDKYTPDLYLSYCGQQHFVEKYAMVNSGCWSCSIINSLMRSLTGAANALSPHVIELAKIITLYGAAVWLAFYFLKSVSSAAAQDPAKNLDGALVFMFKIAFVYFMIVHGIGFLVQWIVNPLLGIGIDISRGLNTMQGSASSVASATQSANFDSIVALHQLNDNVTMMAEQVNAGASEMMKFADMIICNAVHGRNSYTTFVVAEKVLSVKIQLIDPLLWLSGAVLYVLGFGILLIASFYMFDVAFNVSVTLLIMPLGLALWPFGWTRDKLKPMIESIAYYTGIFIFLPLGILLSVKLIKNVATDVFSGAGAAINFIQAFEEDNADIISDNLGFFSIGFLKILLCYIIAIRVVPLMADEFCTHFFGNSLLGSPLSEKITQGVDILKKKTIGRVSKYGQNVAKHQVGEMVKKSGDKNGNFLDRAIYNYGKSVAKTKK